MNRANLSEEEVKTMRQDSDRVLDLLRHQYDSMSAESRAAVYDRAEKAAREAMEQFNRELDCLRELKRKNPDEQIAIHLEYRAPKNAFATYGGPHIEWGMTNAESKTVLLLRWLIFAPEEVIRGVLIHEAFHILFAALDPSCLPNPPSDETLEDYPEHQRKEEQWVRAMTQKLGYDEHLITVWEQTLLVGGENWHTLYHEFKNEFRRRLAQD